VIAAGDPIVTQGVSGGIGADQGPESGELVPIACGKQDGVVGSGAAVDEGRPAAGQAGQAGADADAASSYRVVEVITEQGNGVDRADAGAGQRGWPAPPNCQSAHGAGDGTLQGTRPAAHGISQVLCRHAGQIPRYDVDAGADGDIDLATGGGKLAGDFAA